MPSKNKVPRRASQPPKKATGSPRTGATEKQVLDDLQTALKSVVDELEPVSKSVERSASDLQYKSTKEPGLNNRSIIASKLGCAPTDFLVYREEPGGLIVAITPDGRKFKFNLHDLTPVS